MESKVDPTKDILADVTSENAEPYREFWRQALAVQGSIMMHVLPNVILSGVVATIVCFVAYYLKQNHSFQIGFNVSLYEVVGGALGLLLVLRTNAGYDRWWEGRKLWGGIVNQSRNLCINALSYGPNEPEWRSKFVRWVAVFGHVSRMRLRHETESPEVTNLIGEQSAQELFKTEHMPSAVSMMLGGMLKDACDRGLMTEPAFLQAEQERAKLIDHLGACERILRTPLAMAYSVKIRQFIALFILTLPFALVNSLGAYWQVPLLTMMVAYPLLSLDQLGVELQNPFSTKNLSHLPLAEISKAIEKNVLSLLRAKSVKSGDLDFKVREQKRTEELISFLNKS